MLYTKRKGARVDRAGRAGGGRERGGEEGRKDSGAARMQGGSSKGGLTTGNAEGRYGMDAGRKDTWVPAYTKAEPVQWQQEASSGR